MLPYQKFPSIYKQYPQPYQQDQVPQTPFDMAYGSSLLPRQLLVGSPYIQVQSPLPSPVHHGSFQVQRTPGGITSQQNQSYFVPAAPPKLNFPPESARKRGLNYHKTLQRHHSSNSATTLCKRSQISNDMDETPSKPKFKSTSSSSSSLNDSTFDNQPMLESQTLYSNGGAISSSSSLYNLHQINSNPLNTATVTRISNFQISRQPTRSIILLNMNQGLSISDFLNTITFGPIENVRIVESYPDEEHNSVVLAFLKIETCLNFYNNILTYLSKFKKANKSPDLSINFITTKKLLPFISNAINSDGATRNVYVGNLKSLNREVDEEFLQQEFSKFGIIEKIDLIAKKSEHEETEDGEKKEVEEEHDQFAFIHFTNIASAIKAVEQLSLSPNWPNVKIFYGTDRCSINSAGSIIRSITDEQDEEINQISEEDEDELQEDDSVQFHPQHHQHEQQRQLYIPRQFITDEDISSALNQKNLTAQAVATNAGGANNAGNRTVYLGNLDPKTKPEDICNVVRGGVLQNIKHFAAKKICFLTFIEPVAAAQFYANANIDGITLHGRKLKIGWGNHSGSLPNSIALAVTVGASRNVYIGIKDQDLDNSSLRLPSEEVLRHDFSKFGEIEQINFFKNDRCVFLNFLNISNAIKAVDDANGNSSEKFHEYFNGKYREFKISFGKDRCGNPPKAKKNKKKNKNRRRDQYEDEGNKESTEDQVEKLSEGFLNSMGISSKDQDANEDNEQQETKEAAEYIENNAFGISAGGSNANNDAVSETVKVEEEENEKTEKGEEGDDELYDSSSSSEALDLIVSPPEARPYTPSRSSSEELTSKGNNNNFKKHSNRSKKRPTFSPAMSSRVSSASLNSLGYFPYQDQDAFMYKQVPFAPPPPSNRSFSNMSRGSSRTNLSNYGGHHHHHHQQSQHHPHSQYHSNGFTTSGSQVMAQYLAQSQHANMIYAANVMNTTDDYGYEDDNAGYYHYGYNNSEGGRSYGSSQRNNHNNNRSRR